MKSGHCFQLVTKEGEYRVFVQASEIDFDEYDVLIAGSGLAAASVAKSASQSGLSVLMIETGGIDYDDLVQTSFTEVVGRGHITGSQLRNHWIRSLGGTSSIWEGYCSPLSERNLERWPIDRSEIEPYLAAAAKDLGRSPRVNETVSPWVDGFQFRPISHGDPLRLRWDSMEIFQSSDGIDTLLGTSVSKLIPRSDRRGIAAIRLSRHAQSDLRVELREKQSIVLAAGALGNPQILLSSSEGESMAVGNENDQVGRYLMEHPHLHNCGRAILSGSLKFPDLPQGFGDAVETVVPNDALYRAIGELDLSIMFWEAPPEPEDRIESYLFDRFGAGARTYTLSVQGEMAPDAENRVELAAGHDPAGLRRVKTTCIISSETFRAVDTALETLGGVLASEGHGRIRIVNENLFHNVVGGGHIMGTTRMGDNPRTSVVDSDCRVHGYSNLFVAGSSVFATSGYANPTMNLMALAIRLGKRLGNIT